MARRHEDVIKDDLADEEDFLLRDEQENTLVWLFFGSMLTVCVNRLVWISLF